MTREEMNALANQAGMSNLSLIDIGYLEAFVNLILEAVAVECDSLEYAFKPGHECAETIRSMKV